MLDEVTNVLALGGIKSPVITVYFISLNGSGFVNEKVEIIERASFRTIIDDNENFAKQTTIELGEVHIGYVVCYEKDNIWQSDSEPPAKNGIFSRAIYKGYDLFPRGEVVLSSAYPKGNYKVIAFREIDSFVDKSLYGVHYYKIAFQSS